MRYSLAESARVRRQQRRRLRQRSRRLPAQRRRASRLRLDELGVRREHEDAVLRAPERRSSLVVLRGDEEGERADGAHLRASVSLPVTRACASSRSTGRGVGRTWRCSCSRRTSSRASRSTSSTTATTQPRLHVHRRHRRRASCVRSDRVAAAERAVEQRCTRIRARARRRIASTTSATTSRSS